jgi:hypothetical protein
MAVVKKKKSIPGKNGTINKKLVSKSKVQESIPKKNEKIKVETKHKKNIDVVKKSSAKKDMVTKKSEKPKSVVVKPITKASSNVAKVEGVVAISQQINSNNFKILAKNFELPMRIAKCRSIEECFDAYKEFFNECSGLINSNVKVMLHLT